MRKFIEEKPVLSAVLLEVLFTGISFVINWIWILPDNISSYVFDQLLWIVIPFVMVALFGDLKIYKVRGIRKTLGVGAYMAVTSVLSFVLVCSAALSGGDTNIASLPNILLGILVLFGVGFREESLYRGIFVNIIAKKYAIDKKGIYFTAIVSGLIFGAVHMTNFFYGVGLMSMFVQSVVAVGVGFYLAAVYLRGKSIWGMIILHMAIDAAGLFTSLFTTAGESMADSINNLTIANITPFFIYAMMGVFLLRDEKCEEIINNREAWKKSE